MSINTNLKDTNKREFSFHHSSNEEASSQAGEAKKTRHDVSDVYSDNEAYREYLAHVESHRKVDDQSSDEFNIESSPFNFVKNDLSPHSPLQKGVVLQNIVENDRSGNVQKATDLAENLTEYSFLEEKSRSESLFSENALLSPPSKQEAMNTRHFFLNRIHEPQLPHQNLDDNQSVSLASKEEILRPQENQSQKEEKLIKTPSQKNVTNPQFDFIQEGSDESVDPTQEDPNRILYQQWEATHLPSEKKTVKKINHPIQHIYPPEKNVDELGKLLAVQRAKLGAHQKSIQRDRQESEKNNFQENNSLPRPINPNINSDINVFHNTSLIQTCMQDEDLTLDSNFSAYVESSSPLSPLLEEGHLDEYNARMDKIKKGVKEAINCILAQDDKTKIDNANNQKKILHIILHAFYKYACKEEVSLDHLQKMQLAFNRIPLGIYADDLQEFPILSIFNELKLIIEQLNHYQNYDDLINNSKNYNQANPNITKTPIEEQLLLPLSPLYKQIIDLAPCYTAEEWFKTTPKHPTEYRMPSFILGDHKTDRPYQFFLPGLNKTANELRNSLASSLNFHQKFPIINELKIGTNPLRGNLQSIPSHLKTLTIFDEFNLQLPGADGFQKLLIFDFLFCNTHRSYENILISAKDQDTVVIYGIDNHHCFQVKSGNNFCIRADYAWRASLVNQGYFSKSALELVSPEVCEEYEKILTSYNIDPLLISWMKHVAEVINKRGGDEAINKIFHSLTTDFNRHFASLVQK